jgi:hypothetical protein
VVARAMPNIVLGSRPIIGYSQGQFPGDPSLPAAASLSIAQLEGIPNIRAAEIQALRRLSPDAWSRWRQYARTNRYVFSVKGKIAEEVYLSSGSYNSRQQEAVQIAATLSIPASSVKFTQDVRGQSPTRTSSGAPQELGDGMWYAVHEGKLYVLVMIESKSPSNKAELAHRISDKKSEYLGQPGWDFERLRELPVIVDGRTFAPEDVRVSRNVTRWVGVLPQGKTLSARSLSDVRAQLKTIGIDNIDVSDSVLNAVARLLIGP